MFDDAIAPSILAEFVDESLDSLESLPSLFIEMEKKPQDTEVINAIFRPVHSIKGNSAFFGMLKLKNITHEMETTLDLCRNHELTPNQKIIDILLKGLDEVIEIFGRIRNGEQEVLDEEKFNSLVEEIRSSQQLEEQEIAVLPDFSELSQNLKSVLESGILDGSDEKVLIENSLQMVEQLYCPIGKVSESEDTPESTLDLYTQIFNWIDDSGDEELEEDECTKLTELLDSLGEQIEEGEAKELFSSIRDEYETFVSTVGLDSLLRDLLKEKLEPLKELYPLEAPITEELEIELEPEPEELIPMNDLAEVEEVPVLAVEESTDPIVAKEDKGEQKSNKTMRVPEVTIDEFLNFVGELVVVREMYDHLRLHFEEKGVEPELTSELRRYTDNFRQVSGELERTCMNIRKQPIKTIIQKIPRIVRDVASACGKKINVEINGDEISVDKSLIGILEAPLVHMTRNAAGHGIETIQERLDLGKDETGLIKIDVLEDDEYIFIEISDNGKGLNFEALRQKGISMGVFNENDKPSEQEISQIIFMSGVSTAEKVTDISGRGVGMDVVKKYIEGAGGLIQIQSTPGEGSKFTIQMRKSITTQIIDGLILKLNETHYVIPLKYVVESFPPEAENFCNVYDKFEHIKRYDQLLPVVRLNEIFTGMPEPTRSKEEGILIVVDYNGQKIALLVDQIVNIQQVVLKPLKGLHMNKELFTGGALRGDGYISLILNIEKLINERTSLTPIS